MSERWGPEPGGAPGRCWRSPGITRPLCLFPQPRSSTSSARTREERRGAGSSAPEPSPLSGATTEPPASCPPLAWRRAAAAAAAEAVAAGAGGGLVLSPRALRSWFQLVPGAARAFAPLFANKRTLPKRPCACGVVGHGDKRGPDPAAGSVCSPSTGLGQVAPERGPRELGGGHFGFWGRGIRREAQRVPGRGRSHLSKGGKTVLSRGGDPMRGIWEDGGTPRRGCDLPRAPKVPGAPHSKSSPHHHGMGSALLEVTP